MSISPIVEKVQKLLALSKSNNIHEATAAAAAANRLIDQYRLSECDLESTSEVELEPIEEDSDYIYQSGKITPWKNMLIMSLVKHYGCAIWNDIDRSGGRKVSRFKMVGKRSDIGIVRYMFAWLTTECQRLADFQVKGQGRVAVASYCQGFVMGVATQLALSRAEVQKQATSAAIIRIDAREALAREAMYQMHSNLRTVKTKSQAQIDPNAYAMGRQQGSNLHLGARMNSGGTKLLGQ